MANLFFVGAISSAYNDAGNWDTVSGGPGGAGVPGSSDVAIFDSNSPTCVVDVNIDVAGVDLQSTFANTFDMNGFNYTVGASGFTHAGGTFLGKTGAADINGPFNQSGGTHTATSGQWDHFGDFIYTAGTFNHGSGSFKLDKTTGNQDWQPGGVTFNNFEIAKGPWSLTTGGTCTVIGTFVLTSIGNGFQGTFNLEGDARSTDGPNTNWDSQLIFNGTGNQTVDANGGTGAFPGVEINKPSGTIFWNDTIEWAGDDRTFKHTAGTHDFSGLVKFRFLARNQFVDVPNSLEFTKPVDINPASFNLTVLNGPWKISGKLTLQQNGGFSGTGTVVEALGDVTITNSTITIAQQGKLVIKGSGDQIVDAAGGTGSTPNIEIDKPSGKVTFKDRLIVAGSGPSSDGFFKRIAGDIVFDPTSIIELEARHKDVEMSTQFVFQELELDQGAWDYRIVGSEVRTKRLIITGGDGVGNNGKTIIEEFLSAQDTGHTGNGSIEFQGDKQSQITAVAGNDLPNGVMRWKNKRGRCKLLTDFVAGGTSGDTEIEERALVDLNGFNMTVPNDLEHRGWIDNKAGGTVTVTGTHNRRSGSYIGDTRQIRHHKTRDRARLHDANKLKGAYA